MENADTFNAQIDKFIKSIPSSRLSDVKKAMANAIDRRTAVEHSALVQISSLLGSCPQNDWPIYLGISQKRAQESHDLNVFIQVSDILTQMGWDNDKCRQWVYEQAKCIFHRQKIRRLLKEGEVLASQVREQLEPMYIIPSEVMNRTLR